MAVRRRSHFLLIKETYHNGLVGTVLAGLGGLGTIVGVAGLISSQLVSDIPKYTWVIFLFVVLFGSFLIRIPRFRGRFAFEPGLWSIELNVGDLFEQGSGIVVTVDRRLSLDLDQTGPDSLVSQLVEDGLSTIAESSRSSWPQTLRIQMKRTWRQDPLYAFQVPADAMDGYCACQRRHLMDPIRPGRILRLPIAPCGPQFVGRILRLLSFPSSELGLRVPSSRSTGYYCFSS